MSIIYHHTNANGLIGILKNKNLWATDINFLNDYNEYKIGIKALKKVCDDLINREIVENHAHLKAVYVEFLKIMRNSITENLNSRNHYIVSFTNSRDNLRQWMSYGASNSSYAIGFNKEKLKNIKLGGDEIASNQYAYSLNDVAYDISNIEKKLSIDQVVKNIKASKIENGRYALDLVNELLFGLCALKEHSFNDENETRMVLQDRKIGVFSETIQYRTQAGVITPYIEIPFDYDAIEEIIIGPNMHNELASHGLKCLLNSYGIDCVIKHTECSLRQF